LQKQATRLHVTWATLLQISLEALQYRLATAFQGSLANGKRLLATLWQNANQFCFTGSYRRVATLICQRTTFCNTTEEFKIRFKS
jgi:hypothetical protein